MPVVHRKKRRNQEHYEDSDKKSSTARDVLKVEEEVQKVVAQAGNVAVDAGEAASEAISSASTAVAGLVNALASVGAKVVEGAAETVGEVAHAAGAAVTAATKEAVSLAGQGAKLVGAVLEEGETQIASTVDRSTAVKRKATPSREPVEKKAKKSPIAKSTIKRVAKVVEKAGEVVAAALGSPDKKKRHTKAHYAEEAMSIHKWMMAHR